MSVYEKIEILEELNLWKILYYLTKTFHLLPSQILMIAKYYKMI